MLLLDNNTTCYSCNLEKKIKIWNNVISYKVTYLLIYLMLCIRNEYAAELQFVDLDCVIMSGKFGFPLLAQVLSFVNSYGWLTH